jgi:hypothetical protein
MVQESIPSTDTDPYREVALYRLQVSDVLEQARRCFLIHRYKIVSLRINAGEGEIDAG